MAAFSPFSFGATPQKTVQPVARAQAAPKRLSAGELASLPLGWDVQDSVFRQLGGFQGSRGPGIKADWQSGGAGGAANESESGETSIGTTPMYDALNKYSFAWAPGKKKSGILTAYGADGSQVGSWTQKPEQSFLGGLAEWGALAAAGFGGAGLLGLGPLAGALGGAGAAGVGAGAETSAGALNLADAVYGAGGALGESVGGGLAGLGAESGLAGSLGSFGSAVPAGVGFGETAAGIGSVAGLGGGSLPPEFSGFQFTGADPAAVEAAGSLTGPGTLNSAAAQDAAYGAAGGGSSGGFFSGALDKLGALGSGALSSLTGGGGNSALDKFLGGGAAALGAGLATKALAGSPPTSPSASSLINQQTAANADAAKLTAQLNRVDTTTPFGFQKFGQVADPSVPGGIRYTQDIGFSPEQQKLYDAETSNQLASQGIAGNMQARVAASVASPLDLSSAGTAEKAMSGDAFSADRDKVTSALFDRLTGLRKPQMDRDRAALDVQLRNQGLMPGTEAYDNGMRSMLEAQNTELSDAADRAILAGGAEQSRLQTDARANAGLNNQVRSQSIQEALLQRQQPLAEFNAFRTGNTPTLPTFQPFGMTSVAPTNTTSAQQTQYQSQADAYNARIAQLQSLLNFGTSVAKG